MVILNLIILLLLILLLAIYLIVNRDNVECGDTTIDNNSDDEVATRIRNYKCNIEVVSYNGTAIWKLNHKTENYPWHAFVDGKNRDYNSLDEAKDAIDQYQIVRVQRLEEYCRKYPSLTKYKY